MVESTAFALLLHTGAQMAIVQQMEWNIRRVLQNDTAAISTLRCLKLYLERLGCNFLDQESVTAIAVRLYFPSCALLEV